MARNLIEYDGAPFRPMVVEECSVDWDRAINNEYDEQRILGLVSPETSGQLCLSTCWQGIDRLDQAMMGGQGNVIPCAPSGDGTQNSLAGTPWWQKWERQQKKSELR